MEKILIKDLLKEYISYPRAGERLYDYADRLIRDGQTVVMDMDGVDSVPTLFMNPSFGRLIKEFGRMRVMRSFKFLNITRSQLERIKRYFDTWVDEAVTPG